MKPFLIFAFVFLSFQPSRSQNNTLTPQETENIQYFSKIWGFLKYYHPEVATGKLDWDKEFVKTLPEIRSLNTKEGQSAFYLNWIAQLGKIKECKKCSRVSEKEYSSKNFDLSWLDNDFFTPDLQKKLRDIEKNRFYGKNHSVTTKKKIGNVVLNEESYENLKFPNEDFRLLDLVRFWNIIEYFYPYKYLTNQKWEDVLLEMIPVFINADSQEGYDLARLELVSKLNDTHAFFTVHETNNFGLKWIPSTFYITNDSVPVISKPYNDSLAKLNGLKAGDKITAINGVGVKEVIQAKSKYIPASNTASTFRQLQHAVFNGNSDSVHIRIDRSGKLIDKQIGRYPAEMLHHSETETSQPFKIIEGDIGYIRLNMMEISRKEVTDLTKKYKQECPRAIIFDLRAYPPYSSNLLDILGSPQKTFVKRLLPDISYPGKFYWEEALKSGGKNKNPYTGKVIILVNEYTQSRGEYITMLLQAFDNSTTVGRTTAGTDGSVSQYSFLGNRETMFTGAGIYYPDKTPTQRKGVKIDVVVEEDYKSITEGSDKILDTALELLR